MQAYVAVVTATLVLAGGAAFAATGKAPSGLVYTSSTSTSALKLSRAEISGQITVSIGGTADVKSVSFFVDDADGGGTPAQVVSAAPFSFNLDVSTLSVGAHSLLAIVVKTDGSQHDSFARFTTTNSPITPSTTAGTPTTVGTPASTTPPAAPALSTGTITNSPTEPAGIVYSDTDGAPASYNKPGAMLVAGRVNYDVPAMKDFAAAGGTMLIYIDPIINASYGKYHEMLLLQSACGAAVPLWPGSPTANEWGKLNDFRVGGVEQQKLECVLEAMVADNPHMAGWFVDDTGSRSWYPDIPWDSWSAADQQAYRDGAIEITKTFRKVADRHGLIFIVNGTWSGGDLASSGGGYPDASQTGNALADGGVIEHHDGDDMANWKNYSCAPQWAAQSPVTQGKSFMFSITSSQAGVDAFAATGCISWATIQDDYGIPPAPWGAFHETGLPTGVKQ